MTASLTRTGYLQTKEKLQQLEARLAVIAARSDLKPGHQADIERSYEDMIRQYRREMKLYEANHPEQTPAITK